MSTINEKIEKTFLSESDSKVKELSKQYGWMVYMTDNDEYKSSDIYKKKKDIVSYLKKISANYNEGKERDLYKMFWQMILDLELSPHFWSWVDSNLDKHFMFNDKFENEDEKITAQFLWKSVILGVGDDDKQD